MLFDALTVFFFLAGSLLLVFNIWHSPGRIILTKLDEEDGESRTLESIARSIGADTERVARIKNRRGRLSEKERSGAYRFASKKAGFR